jgi:hypothetical protein
VRRAEMQLLTGTKPGTEIPVPECEQAWVRLRKLNWPERDEYEAMVGAGRVRDARRYLVGRMVAEFRLPGGAGVVAHSPEDRDLNRERLMEADEELSEWLIRECLAAMGDTRGLRLLELQKALPAIADDEWLTLLREHKRRVDERMGREFPEPEGPDAREQALGNSPGSQEPSMEPTS